MVVVLARRRRYLLVGWLWYLGTLVPVIGLVQVGAQAIADRYTYLPLVGLFLMLAWGVSDLISAMRSHAGWIGRFAAVGAVVVLSVCTGCAWVQTRYWQNTFALFEHSQRVAPGSPTTLVKLGVELRNDGLFEQAGKMGRT